MLPYSYNHFIQLRLNSSPGYTWHTVHEPPNILIYVHAVRPCAYPHQTSHFMWSDINFNFKRSNGSAEVVTLDQMISKTINHIKLHAFYNIASYLFLSTSYIY